MALFPLLLGLASLAGQSNFVGGKAALLPTGAHGMEPFEQVMNSPWWENYDIKERYLCSDKEALVLERNASQAALFSGDTRITLFREASDAPAVAYRNDELRVILRGDELTLEQLPRRVTCLRSEEV